MFTAQDKNKNRKKKKEEEEKTAIHAIGGVSYKTGLFIFVLSDNNWAVRCVCVCMCVCV